jgi:hypothetical protein
MFSFPIFGYKVSSTVCVMVPLSHLSACRELRGAAFELLGTTSPYPATSIAG